MKTTLSALVLSGVALCAMPASSLAQSYRVDLLTLGTNVDVTPSGIAGPYLVGNASTDDGTVAGFWGPGGSQVLGPVAGGTVFGVYGVNRFGTAVGSGGPAGGGSLRGIVWQNGTASFLPVTDADGDTLYGSRARGINAAGTIIGGGETVYGTNGVVWQNGDIRILRGLEPNAEYERSSANAINTAGFIAGNANIGITGNVPQAVVWNPDGSVRVLSGLGEYSVAYGLNESGSSVGYSLSASGDVTAFVNDGTTSTLLPVLAGATDGNALGINDAGLIVGSSSDANTYEGIATLWQGGQAIDLNSLIGANAADWQLVSATAIEQDGTIIGFGYYQGSLGGFRMTPVPEPATLAVLGLGALGVLRRRKR